MKDPAPTKHEKDSTAPDGETLISEYVHRNREG
jgi:hypothetical protein